VQVTIRYFAGARAAAGLPSEDVEIPDGATVDQLLAAVCDSHGERLRTVVAGSSFLLDEIAVRDPKTVLRPGAELDVLPPFAGG
jgi:sulfur-carrier protein